MASVSSVAGGWNVGTDGGSDSFVQSNEAEADSLESVRASVLNGADVTFSIIARVVGGGNVPSHSDQPPALRYFWCTTAVVFP